MELSKRGNIPVKTGAKGVVSNGVGRRKAAVARVWVMRGAGAVNVNGKNVEQYFDTDIARLAAVKPVSIMPEFFKRYDIQVNVQGGGLHAQADAVKLGIARAAVKIDEEARGLLRANGLLTVDSRVKERKKYGQKAARRKFQFVKR